MDPWLDEWPDPQPRRQRSRQFPGNRGRFREPLLDTTTTTRTATTTIPVPGAAVVGRNSHGHTGIIQRQYYGHHNRTSPGSDGGCDMELTSLYYQPPIMSVQQGAVAAAVVPVAQTMARGDDDEEEKWEQEKDYYYPIDPTPNPQGAVQKCIVPLVSHGCMCCQCVRTQELGIQEDCGRFQSMIGPGLYCQPWPFTGITARLDLSIQQVTLKIPLQCRTVDPIWVHVGYAAHYRVALMRAYEAQYRLQNNNIQTFLSTLLGDALRTRISVLTLEELYTQTQDRLTGPVREDLYGILLDYGYELCHLLITQLRPQQKVRHAMNEIKACRLEKIAASHQAEAATVETVVQAQAHAERMYLLGVGTARQRQALMKHFWLDSMHLWKNDVYFTPQHIPTQEEILSLLLTTQYLDVMTAISSKEHDSNSSLFLQHDSMGKVLGPLLTTSSSTTSPKPPFLGTPS